MGIRSIAYSCQLFFSRAFNGFPPACCIGLPADDLRFFIRLFSSLFVMHYFMKQFHNFSCFSFHISRVFHETQLRFVFKIYHFTSFQSTFFLSFIVYLPIFRHFLQIAFVNFVHNGKNNFHVTFHEIITLQMKYYLV